MDLSKINYDEASTGFDTLPEGEYLVIVTEAKEGKTKAGDEKVEFIYEIQDEAFKGRKIWDSMNLGHSKDKARAIAIAQFVALQKAVGVERPDELEQLFNIPFYVKTKNTPKDNDPEEFFTNVKKYISREKKAEGGTQKPLFLKK